MGCAADRIDPPWEVSSCTVDATAAAPNSSATSVEVSKSIGSLMLFIDPSFMSAPSTSPALMPIDLASSPGVVTSLILTTRLLAFGTVSSVFFTF